MSTFHISVHAAPESWNDDTRPDPQGRLIGFRPTAQFQSTFEETAERFTALGMFFEPDGSFAWNRPQQGDALQGMLYDRLDRVEYCEVKGDCSPDMLQQFLAALKGETRSTCIQRIMQGTWLTEAAFLASFSEDGS